MNRKQKTRVIWIASALVVLVMMIGLILFALKQNINLYYTPTQLAQAKLNGQRTIRLGGMVKTGSIQKSSTNLDVTFILTDFQHEFAVSYSGILPDLFRDNQGVVVKGALTAPGHFAAEQVLAKHDEKYMPKEVADSLRESAAHGRSEPKKPS